MFATDPDETGRGWTAKSPVGSALAAAVAVARDHGLQVEEPRVLAETNNVLVALDPAPVVARVARALAPFRPEGGREHLRREVLLASWIAKRGGPVVPPSTLMDPGPHVRDGWSMTFWEPIDGDVDLTTAEAAPVLRELHELIVDYDGPLRTMSPVLDEVPPMLAAALESGALDTAQAEMITERLRLLEPTLRDPGLPMRPLHGDSHAGNLVRLGGRLVWNDLEDCCLGPVEWDLVCLLRARERIDAAELKPYRPGMDPATLDPFVEARTIQGAAWVSLLAREYPDRRPMRDELLAMLAAR